MDKVKPGQTVYWIDARSKKLKKQNLVLIFASFTLFFLLVASIAIIIGLLSKSHIKFSASLTDKIKSPLSEGGKIIKPAIGAATAVPITPQPKPLITEKEKAYINRFLKVAQAEQKKYGIPASIKLAQGMLESKCGESSLATKNNNHFGIKCYQKNCPKGHCSNYSDDSHKDFFRVYGTAWQSYRAHSKLLQGKRYKHLKQHGADYKKWAYGLKKAGYATDKNYSQKLIKLIEDLSLDQYDI